MATLVCALLVRCATSAGEAGPGLWREERAAAGRRLHDRYELAEYHRTDIYRHASTLRMLAAQCHAIAEVGVRYGESTWPLLQGLVDSQSAGPEVRKRYLAMDIEPFREVEEVRSIAGSLGVDYDFLQGDILASDLGGDVDLLFLDTFHAYAQLRAELRIHSRHARRYIVLHDTQIDGRQSECVRGELWGYDNHEHACSRAAKRMRVEVSEVQAGLWTAIEEFLALRPEWRVSHHFFKNNGLTVLTRHVPHPQVPRIAGWGPQCNFSSCDIKDRKFEVPGHLWYADKDALMAELQRARTEIGHAPTAWAFAKLAVVLYVIGLETDEFGSFVKPLEAALDRDSLQPQALLLLATQNCGNFIHDDFVGCSGNEKYTVHILNRLLEAHGHLWEADLMLGTILLKDGQVEEAKAHLEAALLASPWSRQTAGHVGDSLLRAGLTTEAEAVFQDAVSRGLWRSVHQRPRLTFFPAMELLGDGFLAEDRITPELRKIRAQMEDGWSMFRKEALEALDSLRATKENRPSPTGKWSEVHIASNGGWNEDPRIGCAVHAFPDTCRYLEQLFLQIPYTLMLRARLTIVEPPRTIITRHAAAAPGRLRLQCALVVPLDATNLLRVGAEARNMTEEGRCHWFDESFDHDLTYEHQSQGRIALYIDVEHPGLRRESTRGAAELEPEVLSNNHWLQVLCRGDKHRQLAAL